MTTKAFTEEETTQLIELWQAGLTMKDVALAMECKLDRVRNKLRQLRKKGALVARTGYDVRVEESDIQHIAGAHMMPVEVVEHFAKFFTKSKDEQLAGLHNCCEAWREQDGSCYYLPAIHLTIDDSPSSAVPMYGHQNKIVLVSKAIFAVRNTITHEGFVSMCKAIAQKFSE